MKKIKIGLEFEIISTIDRGDVVELLRSTFGKKYVVDTIGSCSSRTNRSKFFGRGAGFIYVTDDFSIRTIHPYRYQHEIITPVMTEAETKNFIKKFYAAFFDSGIARMNKSCGLHVNVSFMSRDMNIKLNPGMLHLVFDIQGWRAFFDRSRSMYCSLLFRKGDKDRIAKKLRNGEPIDSIIKTKMTKALKYDAINISKFRGAHGIPHWYVDGPIEFRMAGGPKCMDLSNVTLLISSIKTAMNTALRIDEKQLLNYVEVM